MNSNLPPVFAFFDDNGNSDLKKSLAFDHISQSCLVPYNFGQWHEFGINTVNRISSLFASYRRKKLELNLKGVPAEDVVLFTIHWEQRQVEDIVQNGLRVDPTMFCATGDSSKGVCLYSHADVLLRYVDSLRLTRCWIIVYSTMLGRTVSVDCTSQQQPTPNFDSHISRQPASPLEPVNDQLSHSQVYIYESDSYNPTGFSCQPRHCVPVASIEFSRSGVPADMVSRQSVGNMQPQLQRRLDQQCLGQQQQPHHQRDHHHQQQQQQSRQYPLPTVSGINAVAPAGTASRDYSAVMMATNTSRPIAPSGMVNHNFMPSGALPPRPGVAAQQDSSVLYNMLFSDNVAVPANSVQQTIANRSSRHSQEGPQEDPGIPDAPSRRRFPQQSQSSHGVDGLRTVRPYSQTPCFQPFSVGNPTLPSPPSGPTGNIRRRRMPVPPPARPPLPVCHDSQYFRLPSQQQYTAGSAGGNWRPATANPDFESIPGRDFSLRSSTVASQDSGRTRNDFVRCCNTAASQRGPEMFAPLHPENHSGFPPPPYHSQMSPMSSMEKLSAGQMQLLAQQPSPQAVIACRPSSAPSVPPLMPLSLPEYRPPTAECRSRRSAGGVTPRELLPPAYSDRFPSGRPSEKPPDPGTLLRMISHIWKINLLICSENSMKLNKIYAVMSAALEVDPELPRIQEAQACLRSLNLRRLRERFRSVFVAFRAFLYESSHERPDLLRSLDGSCLAGHVAFLCTVVRRQKELYSRMLRDCSGTMTNNNDILACGYRIAEATLRNADEIWQYERNCFQSLFSVVPRDYVPPEMLVNQTSSEILDESRSEFIASQPVVGTSDGNLSSEVDGHVGLSSTEFSTPQTPLATDTDDTDLLPTIIQPAFKLLPNYEQELVRLGLMPASDSSSDAPISPIAAHVIVIRPEGCVDNEETGAITKTEIQQQSVNRPRGSIILDADDFDDEIDDVSIRSAADLASNTFPVYARLPSNPESRPAAAGKEESTRNNAAGFAGDTDEFTMTSLFDQIIANEIRPSEMLADASAANTGELGATPSVDKRRSSCTGNIVAAIANAPAGSDSVDEMPVVHIVTGVNCTESFPVQLPPHFIDSKLDLLDSLSSSCLTSDSSQTQLPSNRNCEEAVTTPSKPPMISESWVPNVPGTLSLDACHCATGREIQVPGSGGGSSGNYQTLSASIPLSATAGRSDVTPVSDSCLLTAIKSSPKDKKFCLSVSNVRENRPQSVEKIATLARHSQENPADKQPEPSVVNNSTLSIDVTADQLSSSTSAPNQLERSSQTVPSRSAEEQRFDDVSDVEDNEVQEKNRSAAPSPDTPSPDTPSPAARSPTAPSPAVCSIDSRDSLITVLSDDDDLIEISDDDSSSTDIEEVTPPEITFLKIEKICSIASKDFERTVPLQSSVAKSRRVPRLGKDALLSPEKKQKLAALLRYRPTGASDTESPAETCTSAANKLVKALTLPSLTAASAKSNAASVERRTQKSALTRRRIGPASKTGRPTFLAGEDSDGQASSPTHEPWQVVFPNKNRVEKIPSSSLPCSDVSKLAAFENACSDVEPMDDATEKRKDKSRIGVSGARKRSAEKMDSVSHRQPGPASKTGKTSWKVEKIAKLDSDESVSKLETLLKVQDSTPVVTTKSVGKDRLEMKSSVKSSKSVCSLKRKRNSCKLPRQKNVKPFDLKDLEKQMCEAAAKRTVVDGRLKFWSGSSSEVQPIQPIGPKLSKKANSLKLAEVRDLTSETSKMQSFLNMVRRAVVTQVPLNCEASVVPVPDIKNDAVVFVQTSNNSTSVIRRKKMEETAAFSSISEDSLPPQLSDADDEGSRTQAALHTDSAKSVNDSDDSVPFPRLVIDTESDSDTLSSDKNLLPAAGNYSTVPEAVDQGFSREITPSSSQERSLTQTILDVQQLVCGRGVSPETTVAAPLHPCTVSCANSVQSTPVSLMTNVGLALMEAHVTMEMMLSTDRLKNQEPAAQSVAVDGTQAAQMDVEDSPVDVPATSQKVVTPIKNQKIPDKIPTSAERDRQRTDVALEVFRELKMASDSDELATTLTVDINRRIVGGDVPVEETMETGENSENATAIDSNWQEAADKEAGISAELSVARSSRPASGTITASVVDHDRMTASADGKDCGMVDAGSRGRSPVSESEADNQQQTIAVVGCDTLLTLHRAAAAECKTISEDTDDRLSTPITPSNDNLIVVSPTQRCFAAETDIEADSVAADGEGLQLVTSENQSKVGSGSDNGDGGVKLGCFPPIMVAYPGNDGDQLFSSASSSENRLVIDETVCDSESSVSDECSRKTLANNFSSVKLPVSKLPRSSSSDSVLNVSPLQRLSANIAVVQRFVAELCELPAVMWETAEFHITPISRAASAINDSSHPAIVTAVCTEMHNVVTRCKAAERLHVPLEIPSIISADVSPEMSPEMPQDVCPEIPPDVPFPPEMPTETPVQNSPIEDCCLWSAIPIGNASLPSPKSSSGSPSTQFSICTNPSSPRSGCNPVSHSPRAGSLPSLVDTAPCRRSTNYPAFTRDCVNALACASDAERNEIASSLSLELQEVESKMIADERLEDCVFGKSPSEIDRMQRDGCRDLLMSLGLLEQRRRFDLEILRLSRIESIDKYIDTLSVPVPIQLSGYRDHCHKELDVARISLDEVTSQLAEFGCHKSLLMVVLPDGLRLASERGQLLSDENVPLFVCKLSITLNDAVRLRALAQKMEQLRLSEREAAGADSRRLTLALGWLHRERRSVLARLCCATEIQKWLLINVLLHKLMLYRSFINNSTGADMKLVRFATDTVADLQSHLDRLRLIEMKADGSWVDGGHDASEAEAETLRVIGTIMSQPRPVTANSYSRKRTSSESSTVVQPSLSKCQRLFDDTETVDMDLDSSQADSDKVDGPINHITAVSDSVSGSEKLSTICSKDDLIRTQMPNVRSPPGQPSCSKTTTAVEPAAQAVHKLPPTTTTFSQSRTGTTIIPHVKSPHWTGDTDESVSAIVHHKVPSPSANRSPRDASPTVTAATVQPDTATAHVYSYSTCAWPAAEQKSFSSWKTGTGGVRAPTKRGSATKSLSTHIDISARSKSESTKPTKHAGKSISGHRPVSNSASAAAITSGKTTPSTAGTVGKTGAVENPATSDKRSKGGNAQPTSSSIGKSAEIEAPKKSAKELMIENANKAWGISSGSSNSAMPLKTHTGENSAVERHRQELSSEVPKKGHHTTKDSTGKTVGKHRSHKPSMSSSLSQISTNEANPTENTKESKTVDKTKSTAPTNLVERSLFDSFKKVPLKPTEGAKAVTAGECRPRAEPVPLEPGPPAVKLPSKEDMMTRQQLLNQILQKRNTLCQETDKSVVKLPASSRDDRPAVGSPASADESSAGYKLKDALSSKLLLIPPPEPSRRKRPVHPESYPISSNKWHHSGHSTTTPNAAKSPSQSVESSGPLKMTIKQSSDTGKFHCKSVGSVKPTSNEPTGSVKQNSKEPTGMSSGKASVKPSSKVSSSCQNPASKETTGSVKMSAEKSILRVYPSMPNVNMDPMVRLRRIDMP